MEQSRLDSLLANLYPVDAAMVRAAAEAGNVHAAIDNLTRNAIRSAARALGASGDAVSRCRRAQLVAFVLDGTPITLDGAPEPDGTPERAPEQTPPASAPAGDEASRAADALAELLRSLGSKQPALDEAAVRAVAEEAARGLAADAVREAFEDVQRPLIIALPERPEPMRIEPTDHPVLRKLIAAYRTRGRVNPWLYGPAGSGKTHVAGRLAEVLGVPFWYVSGSPGLSESVFLGRPTADGRWIDSPFVTLYESGGIILIDECCNLDPALATMVNAALSNGHLSVPGRSHAPLVKRSPDCLIMVADNTTGQGGDGSYDRARMDEAFRSRFVYWLCDYQPSVVAGIAAAHGIGADLVAAWWTVKRNVDTSRVAQVWTPRDLIRLGELHASDPDLFPLTAQALVDVNMAAWSETERAKACDGVPGVKPEGN